MNIACLWQCEHIKNRLPRPCDTIRPMKALDRALRGQKVLVFLDFEGTQYTHEMIEWGAVIAVLNEDHTIKKKSKGFKRYVKAKSRIGHYVTNLTGITEKMLKDEGITYAHAQEDFRKFVGKYWGKCLFVTFGNHDMVIIHDSLEMNAEADVKIGEEITKKNWDFASFIAQFIQDPNGNQLSLTNYLKVFNVPFEGKAHDALADAENLMDLYEAFLTHKDILAKEYEKTLSHFRKMPAPLALVLDKLSKGESVTPEDYKEAIERSLR